MGDAEKGKALFMKMCYQCHTYKKGDRNKIGPNLYGIFGRTCGCKSTSAGMEFDSFLKHMKMRWDEPTMDEFLENPKKFMPNTTMTFAVEKSEDRKDIIEFLKTLRTQTKK